MLPLSTADVFQAMHPRTRKSVKATLQSMSPAFPIISFFETRDNEHTDALQVFRYRDGPQLDLP